MTPEADIRRMLGKGDLRQGRRRRVTSTHRLLRVSNFAQTSLWKHADIKVHEKAVASPMQRSIEQEPVFSVNSGEQGESE